jgi:hypothetical protein
LFENHTKNVWVLFKKPKLVAIAAKQPKLVAIAAKQPKLVAIAAKKEDRNKLERPDDAG